MFKGTYILFYFNTKEGIFVSLDEQNVFYKIKE